MKCGVFIWRVLLLTACLLTVRSIAAQPVEGGPIITNQPSSQQVDAGQTARFEVGASGSPPLYYQWLSNGVAMANRTQRQLTISGAMPSHAGSYSVIVSNEVGTVESDAATLSINVYPPTITSDPTNQTVMEGRVATFAVSATGAPPPSYQWFFNDAPIAGGTKPVLTLRNPRLEDAGSYLVTVSNSEGSVTSSPAILTVTPARTNAGSVDLSFFPGTGANGAITRLALQRDGRILAGGSFSAFNGTNRGGAVRLDSSGNVDSSFAPADFGSGDFQFLEELPDGKILANKTVSGTIRWNADGSWDPSFSTWPSSANRRDVLAVQADGSIVRSFSSQFDYGIQRLRPDGDFDFTFNGLSQNLGGGGIQLPTGYPFVGDELPDGKIVIGGPGLFRIHYHGASDPAFGPLIYGGSINAVLAKPDGKVFVAGSFTNVGGAVRPGLALLNPDSSTDLTFNPAGSYGGSIWAMALQPDGKLLIGGPTPIARLNTDGSVDLSFDPGSAANNYVSSILVQPDGKILVGGHFTEFDGCSRRRIVRLNADPPDPPVITRQPVSQSVIEGANVTFAVENTSVPPAAYQWSFEGTDLPGATHPVLTLTGVSANAAGGYQVIISNAIDSVISTVATLSVIPAPSEPGTVDVAFGAGAGADSTVRATARQPNGKLIIAGWFNRVNGVPRAGIARLNPDGSLDPSFDAGAGPNDRIYAIAVDANDRILVGGAFTDFSGHARNRLARLLPDGEFDTSFEIGTGIQGGAVTTVRAIAVQSDGRIVAGGWFSSFNNNTRYGVARLNTDGSLDSSFVPSTVAPEIESLALQSDGKILAGGRNAVYRFRTNGVSDFIPGPAPLVSGYVRSILVQPDGKIVFAGTFSGPFGAIGRLTPSGAWDNTFSSGFSTGPFATSIETLRLHACGKILVGGNFMMLPGNPPPRYQLARITANGGLDPDFPLKVLDGIVFDIAVDDAKQILIAGQFTKVDHAVRSGLARLHAELPMPPPILAQPVSQTTNAGRGLVLSVGVPNCSDFTFQWQLNGVDIPGATNATLPLPNALVRDAGDYRVMIANGPLTTISHAATIQVVPEARHAGSTDVDFFPPANLDGWVQALALGANGSLLVGGSFTRMGGIAANRVARFHWNGAMDTTFRADSNFLGTVYGLAEQPDGKILATGAFPPGHGDTSLLYRLMPDGRRDTNFFRPSGTGTVYAVTALPDGKILLAGAMTVQPPPGGSRSGVARLNPNGSLDASFAAGGIRYALAMARQSDGRIIVGGTFTTIGQVPRMFVARLLPDGPADPTFDPGDGPNSPVVAVALTRDEKVYIGGNFTEVDGVARTGIARLNHDGSVDLSFDPGEGAGAVWTLATQSDNKLLVGGSFRYAGGLPRPGVARFNDDGSLDATFNPGSGANAQVFVIAFDRTGKIYLGGNFTEYNGFPRDRMTRVNGDSFLLNPNFVGNFQVSLFTFYGQTYVLEFKSSLTDPDWSALPAVLGDGTIKTFTDLRSGPASRWYRVRTQ